MCYSQKFQTSLQYPEHTKLFRISLPLYMFFMPILFHASSEMPNFRDLEIIVFPLIFNSVKPPLYHVPKREIHLLHTQRKRKNMGRGSISSTSFRHNYPYRGGDCGLHWFSLDHLLGSHLSCPEGQLEVVLDLRVFF